MKKTYSAMAALMVIAGCTDQQPPRSFVQPNVLKKSDLVGTWYYIQTVSDAPPTNGSMFIGQSSELMKIKFDVQEDYLYARRAYEQIGGSEDAYAKDPQNYVGQPLAAWKIKSQFDVIRDYNSTTGEQTNKIIESTERPWEEREFLRVDWSQNLVTDYVGIGVDLFFSEGSPQVEPVSWWVSDPTDPDAMHMERNQDPANPDGFAEGEATYLDLTNKMVITPDNLTATYEENGQSHILSYPKCFFSYEQNDCASQVIKLRHAFAKIGPQHDYVPRKWDGTQMNLFGVWDVGLRRLTYNRQYGITNSGFSRTAARFNIWKKSYAGAPDGTTLLAPKDRDVRTIPYYCEGSQPVFHSGDALWPDGVDSIFPEDLFATCQEVVRQWNESLRVAVFDAATGKFADPRTPAGVDATVAGNVPNVFVSCHNPVRRAPADNPDPIECLSNLVPDVDASGNVVTDKNGQPILHARAGDPRHSNIYWVNQEQNAGPLGYGPPLFDPITGETISGQAYIYGAALDTYAARSRDLMLLQNGELANSDFIVGQNVQDWVNAHKSGVAQSPATHEQEEVAAMSKAMDFKFAKAFSTANGYPGLDFKSNTGLMSSMAQRQEAIYGGYFAGVGNDQDAKLSHLVGTSIEKAMMTPEMLAVAGVSPMKQWENLTDLERAKVSPLRSRMMTDQNAKERMKAEIVGVDFSQFDDPGLDQRLAKLTVQYGATLMPHSEQIRQDLRRDIFLAVTLHEVGHNMGERHNFRGSYDSMNYAPDLKDKTGKVIQRGYWSLRIEAMQHPDLGMKPSDGQLHPRYVNKPGGALTQFEIANSIRETQYSSIMDYGAEFNSDLLGLGLYDHAFAKFSYAEYVEVFTDNKTDATSLNSLGSVQNQQTALGFPSALAPGSGLAAISYQSYPELFQHGADGIYQRVDVPYSDVSPKSLDNMGNSITSDSMGRPLVPYYFCSDEFAGNLTCMRFDSGADPYEQAADWISRYQNFYIYNNFKRDRQNFQTSLAYKERIASRYFDPIREQLTWYVLLRADFESFLNDNCNLGFGDCKQNGPIENHFFVDERGWGSFTVAVSLGFDLLGKVITTPEAGWHYKTADGTGQAYWKKFRDDTTAVNDPRILPVDLIDGKYLDTVWDFNGCGYYWFDECQTRIGYMIDKLIAIDVLTQSQAYFIGRDTNADIRQYAIGYIIPYKLQIEEKLGALFADDLMAYAPQFTNVAGTQTPSNPSWVFDDPTPQPAKKLIDPATGFTVQLYAGIYGLSAFPTTFDHDFIDTTQIFVVGNGEASTTDATILADGTSDPTQLIGSGGAMATKEWFYFKDVSGKIFAAHSTPQQPGIVLDINTEAQSPPANPNNPYSAKTVPLRNDQGVRMLVHLKALSDGLAAANALSMSDTTRPTKVAAAQNSYSKYRENVEIMRSLQNAFGYGQYKTDAPFYY